VHAVTAARPCRLRLPSPDPYTGHNACPACQGRKITGDRYTFPSDGATTLVLDVLCAACDGCGRAGHTGCVPRDHGEWRPGDVDVDEHLVDPDDLDEDNDVRVCFSCHGRTWWAVQGFTAGEVYTMRMPCGCAEPLMVAAS
jgi:hypothetical protein